MTDRGKHQRQDAPAPDRDESYQDFMGRCRGITGDAMACQTAWDNRAALVDRRMPGMVFKTNESAAVASLPTEAKPWQVWVEDYVDNQFPPLHEALGQVIAEIRTSFRNEIGLLKRELAVLKEEIAVERGLKTLKQEIATAQADISCLPDVEARVAGEQATMKREMARLRRDLAAAQDRIATLNAEACQQRYVLTEMEKQPRPPTIDPETLEMWKQCVKEWLKQHEEPEPVLLLPSNHMLPPFMERNNGAAPSN